MAIRKPALCTGECGRLVRPPNTTIEDWPGTLGHRARGLCKSCWSAEFLPAPKPTFRPCEQCGHTTRPKPMKVTDAPEGTRVRVGELCAVCYQANGQVSPARVSYIRRELDSYLRSRGRVDTKLKEAS